MATIRRREWREELEIIDKTMKAISGVSDPEELVSVYWNGIGELLPIEDFISVSRRHTTAPNYYITRSSRFAEDINPWTQRHKLPHLSGGIMGDVAYANKPVFMDDLDKRLRSDDPAHFYLQGFSSLIALPQYDGGEGINVTCMLLPAGESIDPSIIPVLHWQSGLFGRGTQNLVLKNQLGEVLEALDRELQTVGEIQRSLLPDQLPKVNGVDLAADYVTSARAGGDYYDFFPLPGGRLGIFIADVSGHGTPAAVLMAITHAIAHAEPGTHAPPDALLTYLNRRLVRSYTRSGAFVTAFYGILDPATGELEYSIAGHNPPRLIRADGVIGLEDAASLPLGIMDDTAYTKAKLTLRDGDLVVFYTDGITEAAGPLRDDGSIERFGTDRLDRLMLECGGTDAADCIARIRKAVAAFSSELPPGDDQTLIALRYGPR